MEEQSRAQIIEILKSVETKQDGGAEVRTPNSHDILSGTILLEGTVLSEHTPPGVKDYSSLFDETLRTHPSLERWLTAFLEEGEQGLTTLRRLLQTICAIKSL